MLQKVPIFSPNPKNPTTRNEKLRTYRGRSDGGTTAKGLEAGVDDLSGVVDLDLELHDVATGGGTDEAGADVGLVLVEGADVAGVVEVVDDPLVVLTRHRLERRRPRR